MAGFNKVILIGNLTKNPELRYTPSGTPVTNFGLAVNRRYRQADDLKEEVCYIDIVVFGKQAEHCGQYLSKGNGVIVDGGYSNAGGRRKTVRSGVSMKWSPRPSRSCPSGRSPVLNPVHRMRPLNSNNRHNQSVSLHLGE